MVKISLIAIVLCALGANLIEARTSQLLNVTLSHGGQVMGRYLTSHDGKGIRAFLGIPYAEPPLDDLRFKAPIPPYPWEGVRDATQDPNMCLHRDPYRRDDVVVGNEDCLYLNVYSPYHHEKIARAIPVMVWFHGGGWQCGSGIRPFYGPDFLLDHEVVLVSGNFRLGPLGFLSTESEECPGNFGMKDQVMILKWVRDNIDRFGGDPNQVTIFGESAGGASGTYHMQSKLSYGLFNKVIVQSGVHLNPWAMAPFPGEARKRALKLGEYLNCDGERVAELTDIINCLRKKSATDITYAFYSFFKWDTDPMIPFPPVVEPDDPDAFLTEHPLDVEVPISAHIPMMIGLTSEEGALKSAALIHERFLNNYMEDTYDFGFPIALYLDHHESHVATELFRRVMEFYFPDGLNTNKYQNLTNLFTDNWFAHGIDQYLRTRLKKSNQPKMGPTYVYYFMHKGAASFTEIFKGGREQYYGACHADELQYLFPVGKELFISAIPTQDDIKMRKQLTQMWADFARNGAPVKNRHADFNWYEAKSYPLDYLRLGNKGDMTKDLFHMEHGLLQTRMDFWNELLPHTRPRNRIELNSKESEKIEL